MRYKNIIFDLGGIVIQWNPDRILKETLKEKYQDKKYLLDIFHSDIWFDMDRGKFTVKEGFEKLVEKYPNDKNEIMNIAENLMDFLIPIPSSVELIKELKNKGFKLYMLSNFAEQPFKDISNRYEFFKLFDGRSISSEIGSIKPEKKIYLNLIEKYNLNPSECFYVDDSSLNVSTAKEFGIEAVQVSTPEILREEFIKWEILP
jgi:putative hydrolase of the HAD superfamily